VNDKKTIGEIQQEMLYDRLMDLTTGKIIYINKGL